MPMEDKGVSSKERVRLTIEPHAFVFTASFSLMVIEVVAGRIMAPYLGSSLYSWTSVIGVVLGGMAVGNWAGGTLAEKGASRRTLGVIFVVAGFVVAASRYVAAFLGVTSFGFLPLQAENLLFAFIVFFPVSVLLSLVTPIVVTGCLTSLKTAGTTIGRIYAVSAIASIAGTFVAGFFLISWFGVSLIMLMVAAVLALVGIYAAADRTVTVSAVTISLVMLLWTGLVMPRFCLEESEYYCIRLTSLESKHLGKGTRLQLDRLVHSYIFEDPRKLEYQYEVTYAIATEYVSRHLGGRPLRALFIGGGGYTMPKYLADRYPDSDLTVVEIDPAVTDLMVRRFGLDTTGPIRSVNEDARMFLARHADGQTYDMVFGDAFNDFSIPYHLTTVEFVRMVRDHLSDGGVYALNIIDDHKAGGYVLSSFVRTLGEVFPHVEIASSEGEWQEGRHTFVLLASPGPINVEQWKKAALSAYVSSKHDPAFGPGSSAERFFSAEERAEALSRKSVTLTDDHAPVDNLTAPVFH